MQTMAIASLSPSALPRPATNRVFYLDTLRIVLTILVIVHHVGQAYGPTGGYWPVQEAVRAPVLGPFMHVNRSFFMSLFFMISGYLMVSAYDRHGFGAFMRNRFVRLGVPVVALAALGLAFRIFIFGEHMPRWDDIFNVEHLWYVEHLLLFSVVYAIWRKLRESSRGYAPQLVQKADRPAPGLPITFAALLLVALACGIVRIWSPVDRWMNLLGFFRVAFADVPRDIAFFIFGSMAFHRGWFENFPTRRGLTWLATGVLAGIAWYAWILIPHGRLGAAAFAISHLVWEELVCFGMCIGLLVLFRQAANFQGRFGKMLAANQYSAYFWQLFFIIPIQTAFLALPLGPFIKFVAVTALSVTLIFSWSWLMRRIPAVRAVL